MASQISLTVPLVSATEELGGVSSGKIRRICHMAIEVMLPAGFDVREIDRHESAVVLAALLMK